MALKLTLISQLEMYRVDLFRRIDKYSQVNVELLPYQGALQSQFVSAPICVAALHASESSESVTIKGTSSKFAAQPHPSRLATNLSVFGLTSKESNGPQNPKEGERNESETPRDGASSGCNVCCTSCCRLPRLPPLR